MQYTNLIHKHDGDFNAQAVKDAFREFAAQDEKFAARARVLHRLFEAKRRIEAAELAL
ncbi:MAG: hypothetical protein AAGI68_14175 [Planctomycetota bacterium]